MKKTEIREIMSEVAAIERGEVAAARVREVIRLPDGTVSRAALGPENYRRKQARAWKAKTEAAKVRQGLNLTQEDFAALLGVALATVRKWERGTGQPSGAAITLLAVAKRNPEVIREAVAAG